MTELCECGQPADPSMHSPLPRPLPWDHGRPCARDPSKQHPPKPEQQVRVRSNAAAKYWERPKRNDWRELA